MPDDADLGLEPDESLLDTLTVSFARRFDRELDLGGFGGTPSAQPRPPLGGLLGDRAFTTVGRYRRWQSHADSVGFPLAGMAMRLGLTERRLLVWQPTFVRARPKALAGALPLSRIAEVTATRGVTSARLYIVLEDGALLTLETMRLSRARRFARRLVEARDRRTS